jgi:hypothetical protein
MKRIGGVMVSVLASSAIDCMFEPHSGQTNDYILVFVSSPLVKNTGKHRKNFVHVLKIIVLLFRE